MANEIQCELCTKKCPQAARAREAAAGRMFATKEFIALQKKVESGQLVEVIRCKDCKQWMYECDDIGLCVADVPDIEGVQRYADDFCSYGERKNENQ